MPERAAPFKPTKEQLSAGVHRTINDVIAPDLRVLFCGINPGLYSSATGHHFARPGNRFWPALFAGGFTPRLIAPWEKEELLKFGIGITNLVARATVAAADLSDEEVRVGTKAVRRKILRYRPRVLAILGIGAYRVGFDRKSAVLGPQEDRIGDTLVWILPNPSGLNAHYTPKALAKIFREMNDAIAA